ncbi:DUF1295 domain-containing protein [Gordonia sp. CPCC 206044]|uniref:DUF1295 domain-containing protein n=1 Tax=Gordonia sp. CPCC 206044 TaxID=3140793 RepID=UPI003AF3D7DB
MSGQSGWVAFLVIAAASVVFLAVLHGITMLIGHRIGRYNVVDVAWGLGFVGIAALALVLGPGDVFRRWLLMILVGVWGLRLSWHMYLKSAGKGEDPRYTELLSRSGGHGLRTVARKIFVIQGVSQWFVSLPIQVSAVTEPTRGIALVAVVVGVALWLLGFTFEAVGDAQLRRFTSDPNSRGTIMDRGLWAWTRHPNYFGDSSVWWGIWLIAASSWPGVLTVLSPVAMTYFLVHATGARLLEESMSRRPGYREYQQRTSYFLPWPPRAPRSP